MNILFIGDIVGKPGRETVRAVLPRLKQELNLDLVIANAENAAGGSSITAGVVSEIFSAGVEIITSGDHIFKKKEAFDIINHPFILRPANLPSGVPGKGVVVYNHEKAKCAVLNLQGRVFMNAIECPFRTAEKIIGELDRNVKVIIVDMHAEATSEKIAMGFFLQEKVSAVCGTHTHVQTADERILDSGAAFISDVGMTGSTDSVIGRNKEQVIEKFLTSLPLRFELAHGKEELQGVLLDIDEKTGKAREIRRVKEKK